MYARRRGRRFSARSQAGSTELAQLELYLRQNLFSWMRADYYTPNGGNTLVDAFPDYVLAPSEGGASDNAKSIDPAHRFAQATDANKVAIPAASALFGGRLVATLVRASGNIYASSMSPASWSFANNASGTYAYVVHRFTSNTGTQVIITSRVSGGDGFTLYRTSAQLMGIYVQASGAVRVNPGSTAGWAQTPFLVAASHAAGNSPNCLGTRNGSTMVSGNYTASPADSNPASTLYIGGDQVGNSCDVQIADVMMSKVNLGAAVARYALLRCGIT